MTVDAMVVIGDDDSNLPNLRQNVFGYCKNF
jgi:hypothetical protein